MAKTSKAARKIAHAALADDLLAQSTAFQLVRLAAHDYALSAKALDETLVAAKPYIKSVDDLALLKTQFMAGGLESILSCDAAKADALLVRGAKRNESEAKAYETVGKRWERVLKPHGLSGLDNRGGARKPRTPSSGVKTSTPAQLDAESGAKVTPATQEPTQEPLKGLDIAAYRPSRAQKPEDVTKFLLAMRAVFTRYENDNAKNLTIETRAVFQAYQVAMRALMDARNESEAKSEAKSETAKSKVGARSVFEAYRSAMHAMMDAKNESEAKSDAAKSKAHIEKLAGVKSEKPATVAA